LSKGGCASSAASGATGFSRRAAAGRRLGGGGIGFSGGVSDSTFFAVALVRLGPDRDVFFGAAGPLAVIALISSPLDIVLLPGIDSWRAISWRSFLVFSANFSRFIR
jgi:hypothetical protein